MNKPFYTCLWALGVLCCQSSLAQGIAVTEAPQTFAVHDGTTGSLIKGGYATHALCVAAAQTLFAATPVETVEKPYRCVQATALTFRRTCDGVPKPELKTFVIIDPNGVRYTFPESEDPPQPGIRVLPTGGTEYTIAEAGGLRVIELPNGDWRTEVEVLVDTKVYPGCWQWQWLPQAEPVVLLNSEGLPFALVPTYMPENIEDMDGNGAMGDETWPTYIPPEVVTP
jgi:hypothetical protein